MGLSNESDRSRPVLIIGAGAFGLASALTLATSGYTNVLVLERDDQIPSRFSAAYDLNKVIRAEYMDRFYTDLSLVRADLVSQGAVAPRSQVIGSNPSVADQPIV